jgi:hypothetical protein
MVSRSDSRLADVDACWHLDGGRLVRIENRQELPVIQDFLPRTAAESACIPLTP